MHRYIVILLLGLLSTSSFGQTIRVDTQSYEPFQLIGDVLINSDCVNDFDMIEAVGGNFGNQDKSFGYFDATGTDFPFENGIVLSTGRLSNVPGPNTSLSDDNAGGWGGDSDLEQALDETNTTNATFLVFLFKASTTQVSFRYIFASEEYQENNPNTCNYSDLFGFLIKPANGTTYTNIALVPNTQTPVKVTTVHPEITNGCEAQNAAWFEGFNDTNSPINFNGQTKVMTATATVIPNEWYRVKLVIADEQNYRYDSAVFLEGGSFQIATDLGPNRLISNSTGICNQETYTLNATNENATNYRWFKDDVLIMNENDATLEVVETGTYGVEVVLGENCSSFGEVIIEFAPPSAISENTLFGCDLDNDGLSIFNLFDAEPLILTNSQSEISDFFLTLDDAEANENAIQDASYYENTSVDQIVYARIVNYNSCNSISKLQLSFSNYTFDVPNIYKCDEGDNDGYTTFDLPENHGDNLSLYYYRTEADAKNNLNAISGIYTNEQVNRQPLYVKIKDGNQCLAFGTIDLIVTPNPVLPDDTDIFFCSSNDSASIELNAGISQDQISDYTFEWFLNGSTLQLYSPNISIEQAGTFSVEVTNLSNCSAVRNFNVSTSEIASIETIDISAGYLNNNVTIVVSGSGNYEYAIGEGGQFQDEPQFFNINSGQTKVFVRDKNGCGIISQDIHVLSFPKVFTPNGDGFNDTWKIRGVDVLTNPLIGVLIFDRFGKLLKELRDDSGWNGTFRGQLLASDDYWFIAKFQDGQKFKGHFTLKR